MTDWILGVLLVLEINGISKITSKIVPDSSNHKASVLVFAVTFGILSIHCFRQE